MDNKDPYNLRTSVLEKYRINIDELYKMENEFADRFLKLPTNVADNFKITMTYKELVNILMEICNISYSVLDETDEFKKYDKTGHISKALDRVLNKKMETQMFIAEQIANQIVLPCLVRDCIDEIMNNKEEKD